MTLPPSLFDAIRAAMGPLPVEHHDPAEGIPLQVVSFGPEEVAEALDAMITTQVTMGRRVRDFEAAWAREVGTAEGIMVNSGSSANLLAWSALVAAGRLRPGDEVIVPAVGWSTTLFPILQAGLVPVLVDVDPTTLCLDVAAVEAAAGPRTRALCPVHLLGCPAHVPSLARTGLLVVEDACAAHGAAIGDRKVGSMGVAGTFSFFFSHHVTTVEGGILVTSDPEVAEMARSLRAHGWIREMRDAARIAAAFPEADPRFLFLTPGYNLRPTEMAAAFGLHQVGRLESFVARRRRNHADWCARIRAAGLPLQVFEEPPGCLHSAFAFPLLLAPDAPYRRSQLQAFLESRRIATRPISGGNLARQPVMARLEGARVAGPLPVADAVHERGLFIGQSHAFGPAHGDLLLQALQEFHHA